MTSNKVPSAEYLSNPACTALGPPSDDTASPQTSLPLPEPRWEKRTEIGRGGMGRVTLVRDRWLDRAVAVKSPISDETSQRLWREVRVTARLEHPGIVSVHDAGLDERGAPWFSMPLIRGRALTDVLAETPLESRHTLLLPFLAACDAVAYAHAEGVIHRDLKPSNLMLGPYGELQVIDWGIAHAPDLDDAPLALSGTPAYMSPEQARAEPVSPASDVWSLGAVLFEILTGAPPFPEAQTPSGLLRALEAWDCSPAPEVPPELGAILCKALTVDKTERYPEASALAAELRRYLEGGRVGAYRYSTLDLLRRLVRAWRIPIAIAIAGLSALAVAITLSTIRVRAERDIAEANLALSLVSEARHALRGLRLGEAAVLATRAARTAPEANLQAEAQGILTAIGPASPKRDRTELAGCIPLATTAALTACVDAEGLVMRGAAGPLWRSPNRPELAQFIGEETLFTQEGKTSRVLDAKTGQARRAPFEHPCHARYTFNLSPSADGGALVASAASCALVIDPAGATIGEPEWGLCAGPASGLLSASYATGSGQLAAACSDGSLIIRDANGERATVNVRFGDDRNPPLVSTIAWVDARSLLIGHADGAVELLELGPSPSRTRLGRQRGIVRALSVAPDGHRAAVLTEASPTLIVDLIARAPLMRLPTSGETASHFASSSLITLALPGARETWDLHGARPLRRPLRASVTTLARSDCGRFIVAGDAGDLVLLDAKSLAERDRHVFPDGIVKLAAFTPSGHIVAHNHKDRQLRVFAPPEPARPGLRPAPRALAGDQIWRRMVTLADGALLLSRHQGAQDLFYLDGRARTFSDLPLVDLATDPRREAIALLLEDGTIHCASNADAPLLPCGEVPGRRIALLAPTLAVVMSAEAVETWELAPGAPDSSRRLERRPTPGAQLTSLFVTSELIAAGARDGVVRLWRHTGEDPIAIVRTHSDRVDSFAAGATPWELLTGGWDGTISVLVAEGAGPRMDEKSLSRTWGLSVEEALRRAGKAAESH